MSIKKMATHKAISIWNYKNNIISSHLIQTSKNLPRQHLSKQLLHNQNIAKNARYKMKPASTTT